MSSPRAVVIPFGVPSEGRGLGLGLAALVHSFVRLPEGSVAIAQLHGSQGPAAGSEGPPTPVEAFVAPPAWKDIAKLGDGAVSTALVLTGAFEPPLEGSGSLQLLAFDPQDGRTQVRVEAVLEASRAGASVASALEQLWGPLGGEIGALRGLKELDWESLESVLRAERCALHDPLRGGAHDRLAAMLHLGRAIEDAPSARYPAERLASLALETAAVSALDPKLLAAASRALERAADDAPSHPELVEALGALQLRLGHAREAERRLNGAIAAAPSRPALYALLSQALRAQGHLDAALAALDSGAAATGGDVVISAERGAVLASKGDLGRAVVAWRAALAVDPVHPPAFVGLAGVALRSHDPMSAQSLVDAALVAQRAHPDVLRCAAQLALATEGEGIARASRLARLCGRLLEAMPDDPWASLLSARSLIALGDVAGARARLSHIERVAPRSGPAADAQLLRFGLDDPGAEQELRSVFRAASAARPEDMADVAARGRRLATLHGAWLGWLAAAIAERRRGRPVAARGALEVAIELAPGAAAVRLELVEVLLEQGDPHAAVEHAQAAVSVEGASPRALVALGRALAAAGRMGEAREAVKHALSIDAVDPAARQLEEHLRKDPPRSPWSARLGQALRRPKK
jgi:tetratricopeptide (TPR) repeat protein